MRDLIRRDQEERAVWAEIQTLVDEAITSGPPESFDFDEFKARMNREADDAAA